MSPYIYLSFKNIIAKVESVEALVNFDAILAESDGIMVARGDLAVEIPMESLANVQKEIVKRCNIAGKPVIVATQMVRYISIEIKKNINLFYICLIYFINFHMFLNIM